MADCGIESRRKSEKIIESGRVSVNGQIVTLLGTKISPEMDEIALDGKIIYPKPEDSLKYIMLHKPEGVITSVSDPQKRRVVLDFISDVPGRLFPVGRLDYDSSGLILLTNDGQMAQKLTHPSFMISKTYIARLRGIPDKDKIQSFREGLYIDDGHVSKMTAPAKFKLLGKPGKNLSGCTAQITISEGRNRQIRKMCNAIGCPVLHLKRISIGPIKLGNLPKGQYRYLTQQDLRQLLGFKGSL